MHCNEYSQGLHYYPFVVNLDRCVASCSTLNYLSNRVCIPNETEHLHAFNMITEINELKTLKGIYHTNINVTLMVESVIQIKSGITINAAVSVKVKKKRKLFWFVTFLTNLRLVQNHCLLGSIKKMALFEIMMELGVFVLFGPEKYGTIYNRIRYLIDQKGDITYFFLS